MNTPPEIPDDENGTVLRGMFSRGDALTEPRMVDFCHIFPERRQALAFAEIVDDRELEVCISCYEECNSWDVQVSRFMVPIHQDITALESSLAAHAISVGGQADGWGCMSCAPPKA